MRRSGNFNDASGVTADRVSDCGSSGILPRLGSGFLLIILALVGAWFGGISLAVLVGCGLALVVHECDRALQSRGARTSITVMGASLGTLGTVLVLAVSSWYWIALAVAVGGGSVVSVLAMNRGSRFDAAILGGLVAWVSVAGMTLLWLSATGGWGPVVWLFAVVWATDTGAYMFGRVFGGPLLVPRLSPAKTWAGAVGGAAAGIGIGVSAGWVLSALGEFVWVLDLKTVVAGSALLSLSGQCGDLVESAYKRRCGIKDSGALIPGHGGAFDRLDSLLAATPVLAVFVYASGPAVWSLP